MIPYSFLKESGYGYDDEYSSQNQRKRVRRNWHTPQSRANARSGTMGSFASMTSMYNNVYSNQNDNNDQEEFPID